MTFTKLFLALTLFTSGSAALAGSELIVPEKITDDDFRFTSKQCQLQLDVNPQVGGRISQLLFDKRNVMTPYACGSSYNPRSQCNGSGSTFWTSPQRAWPVAPWPPVLSLDGAPYTSQIKRKHVFMSSGSNDALGAFVEKDISIDESHCIINLKYTLNASRAVTWAPWEITRVPRGGIAFFAVGDKDKFAAGPLAPRVTMSKDESIAWFDDTGIPALNSVGGSKLIADGRGGWLAYVLDKRLFIKRFPDVPVESIAPNEGDVEIYAGADFLELEVQGKYTALKEYEQLPWNVTWQVVKIPKTVKIAAGSESLLKFVRDQLASLH